MAQDPRTCTGLCSDPETKLGAFRGIVGAVVSAVTSGAWGETQKEPCTVKAWRWSSCFLGMRQLCTSDLNVDFCKKCQSQMLSSLFKFWMKCFPGAMF